MAASVWVWQERHTSDLIFTSGEPEMPWPWATGAAMLDSILGERERLCPYTQCTTMPLRTMPLRCEPAQPAGRIVLV